MNPELFTEYKQRLENWKSMHAELLRRRDDVQNYLTNHKSACAQVDAAEPFYPDVKPTVATSSHISILKALIKKNAEIAESNRRLAESNRKLVDANKKLKNKQIHFIELQNALLHDFELLKQIKNRLMAQGYVEVEC
jgi:hypothetical protein